MSNANTAPVSGALSHSPADQPGRPITASAQQMGDLLRRYPDVDDPEKLQLIDFLKRGHPDTLAMVTYGAGLMSQVARLKKDHPDHFPSGWHAIVPWVGFAVVVLLMIYLAQMI